ncbi:DUF3221 domain-containing protein [Lysinibacillus sp. CTST325]
MKKLLALAIALSFLIAGCGQEATNLEHQEGIIVDIKELSDGINQILVVPNVLHEDISNKKLDELIKLAQEKGGAYYSFEIGKYVDLQVGTHVIVYWDGSQLDSNPPQRGLDKVDIISK